MGCMWKQVDELNVFNGPVVMFEEIGVASKSFRVAGNIINGLQRTETFKKSAMFFQSGTRRVEYQNLGISYVLM